jgi:NADH-quinone oxidoreductase subunit J
MEEGGLGMGLSEWFLMFFAGLALSSALAVVFTRHSVHAALWFIFHLLCLAAVYGLLNAPLLAVIQVLVYAGAVMVLFLFAIMILDASVLEAPKGKKALLQGLGASFCGAALFATALGFIYKHWQGAPLTAWHPQDALDNVASIARVLFKDYLFPFEMVSVLLLVALLGVMVMAGRAPRKG